MESDGKRPRKVRPQVCRTGLILSNPMLLLRCGLRPLGEVIRRVIRTQPKGLRRSIAPATLVSSSYTKTSLGKAVKVRVARVF